MKPKFVALLTLIALSFSSYGHTEAPFPAAKTTPAQEIIGPAKTTPAMRMQPAAPTQEALAIPHTTIQSAYSDREFLSAMLAHHEEAIAMANTLLASPDNVDAQVRAWARQIHDSQRREADQMRILLSGLGGEEPQVVAEIRNSISETTAAADQFSNPARGFVQAMLPHHAAALTMAFPALTQSQRPQVAELAETIILEQTTEIIAFRRWLANHHGS